MSEAYIMKVKLQDYFEGLIENSIEERNVLKCRVIADTLMIITNENKFVFKKSIF